MVDQWQTRKNNKMRWWILFSITRKKKQKCLTHEIDTHYFKSKSEFTKEKLFKSIHFQRKHSIFCKIQDSPSSQRLLKYAIFYHPQIILRKSKHWVPLL